MYICFQNDLGLNKKTELNSTCLKIVNTVYSLYLDPRGAYFFRPFGGGGGAYLFVGKII